MHWLASHNRDEFLATPTLVRFDYAQGENKREPTLLIKCNTLLLKYVVLGVRLDLVFLRLESRLGYAVRIWDDSSKPVTIWSMLEREEEKNALFALAAGEPCQVFLFNELAVNVAWQSFDLEMISGLEAIATATSTVPVKQSVFERHISPLIDSLPQTAGAYDQGLLITLPNSSRWNAITSTYLLNGGGGSPINIFDANEGAHQENLGVWLTDSLQSAGVHHSPQIPKGTGSRELTDLLLSHKHGAILFESKALSILGRGTLPGREKLTSDVLRHIEKAIGQLEGAMRQLRLGTPITSRNGQPIEVERNHPAHCVVVIPDLYLVQGHQSLGLATIETFMKSSGAFIHLIDVSELLRIVQAAGWIAEGSKKSTILEAFDFYLTERAKISMDAKTLGVQVIYHEKK